MQVVKKETVLMLFAMIAVTLLSGCTDWKKKYNQLNVQHQNLQGLLESERAQKGLLASEVSLSRQTIEELQRQIDEQQKTPGQASGFGDELDVSFDAQEGTITVTLPNEIIFASGMATLLKSTSSELDHIRSVLDEKYSGRRIDVVGHTDSDPIKKSKWNDNWELSSQRALTVLRYLVKQGISEDKICAVGQGASLPRASNATSGGKAKNRRVEIVVHMR